MKNIVNNIKWSAIAQVMEEFINHLWNRYITIFILYNKETIISFHLASRWKKEENVKQKKIGLKKHSNVNYEYNFDIS